ncbi:hypothetical protein [Methanoregula sp.]|uniref:hypothetical protein n=1 Tax=Methanoregula sp. TaxID=2052170 RepID=UPI003C70BA64
MQGESFCDCPLMAALASIAWVNRMFIVQNTTKNNIVNADGSTSTSYTFTFWDYGVGNTIGQNVPLNGPLNPVDANNNPKGIKTLVTVNAQVLLDNNSRFSDPNGTFYGAGSNNANEVWPALFERAYAKFCYYENGINPSSGALQCANSNDQYGNLVHIISGPDPAFADVQNLTMNQWGGNAGIGLMYLTGRNCFRISTTSANFSVPLNSSIPTNVNSPSLYNFIKAAFCSESRLNVTYGRYKTRYPLVAWTYPSGDQYSPSTIPAPHCYPILGVFDSTDGSGNNKSYIVLRTTYGLQDPSANLGNVSPVGNGSWNYWDARFPIGSTGKYPSAGRIPQLLDLSLPGDAIFGLDQAVFSTYFPFIGWAEGY